MRGLGPPKSGGPLFQSLYLLMKKDNHTKLIIITIILAGFFTGYGYYVSDYNNSLLDAFLMPGLFFGMVIGGGPHGNMSEITVGLGTGIQFFILYYIIKYLFTLFKHENNKKI